MAGFGRSNSLSINTSGSLFGNNNTSQGQQSAGLFGASTNNATSQPATAGGLFGSTSQPQTGGLFGGAPAAQPPQSNSLFGASQQASQPQSAGLFGSTNKPATGGLFGASTAASQPQQSGGLFGGALGGNAQNQNQNQNQTQNQGTSQSGGLFTLGQPPKPSLFGASTQQVNSGTGSLFGNANTQQQNQTSAPSLFGSTQQNQQQQQQQQQNSLFGGMASQNLGNQSLQNPVQVNAVESLKGTTRFGDLHPDLQNAIQDLDNKFQGQISNAHRIREILPGQAEMVASIAPDVAYIEQFLQTVELGLDNDSANISRLKDLVEKDVEEATLSFRAITNYELPAQFHYGNATNLTASKTKGSPNAAANGDDDLSKPLDLVSYFSKRADDLSGTLELYQRQIREIEAHLRTMEAGTVEKAQQLAGSRSGVRDQRRELVEALRAIEGAILESAKKVGHTRDLVTQQTLGSVGAAML